MSYLPSESYKYQQSLYNSFNNELLSGILADIETSISSLYLFSIHYNKNIYLVNNENRTYIKFGTKLLEETDDDSYKKKIVIYYQSNNKKQK